MTLASRIKTAKAKTVKFIDVYAQDIVNTGLLLTAAGLLYTTNYLLNQDRKRNQEITDLQAIAVELYEHPRYAEKNEDGSFTVTRLSKGKKTEDTPV